MTYFDVKERIETLKKRGSITDCAYLKLAEKARTPFAVYYCESEAQGGADDENVVKTQNIVVELYTDERDFDLEAEADELFSDTAFEKLCTYVPSEHMHMTAYSFEITNLIN